jgi:hypothetical protein
MSLWTTKLGRHFIYTRFGIEYCRERVRQLLHELGFRLRRLRHRHLKANPRSKQSLSRSWRSCWRSGPRSGSCFLSMRRRSADTRH